jgi:tetratricopeptide (TPR) repeat protein
MGPYGLARVLQEQGRYREAIAGFEQALAILDQAAGHYRIGQSALALNDKPRAAAEFAKALAFKTGLSKDMQANAEAQLKALRG